ncbi:phage head morphogenesis protein [Neisseria maigaei]|uniref:phage head morphogenesis protein n=1 Tax=Neisseria maigaei TaxID=2830651 RepID=UPI00265882B0|nr:phage minor head protein [Neisseria maigaei]
MADLSYAFGLEPEQAVKYFEGLGFNVPSDWKITWNEAQAKARAIAGIHKQDIAAQIHGALYESLKNGTSFEKFRDDLAGRLKQHDWQLLKDGDIVHINTGEVDGKGITVHRLETIFRTQMQSAYMAGHWQALEDGRDSAPWLQYSAILDSRTRQSHAAAHGAVYHIDDPFWDYFYPPNGFNCRCTVRAFSDRDLKRRNLLPQKAQLEDTEVVVNRKGDTRPAKAVKLADGSRFYTDAGFQNNVGKSHLANLGQLQMQRAVELPPKLASVAVGAALKDPPVMRATVEAMANMVRKAQADGFQTGQFLHVGVLSLAVLETLEAKGFTPSALISVNDDRLWHSWRDKKVRQLPIDFWERLPEHLNAPDEIRLSRSNDPSQKDALLFIYDLPNNKSKLVITMDYKAAARNPFTGKKEKFLTNMVNTGAVVDDPNRIISLNAIELLWKKP